MSDCYRSPLLTAFLALSLLCLACGNSAAVLAATGLQRDSLRQPTTPTSFEVSTTYNLYTVLHDNRSILVSGELIYVSF